MKRLEIVVDDGGAMKMSSANLSQIEIVYLLELVKMSVLNPKPNGQQQQPQPQIVLATAVPKFN